MPKKQLQLSKTTTKRNNYLNFKHILCYKSFKLPVGGYRRVLSHFKAPCSGTIFILSPH